MSQVVQDGTYRIEATTGMCLEFSDQSANLTAWGCYLGGTQQQWDVQSTGNGTYSIRNVEYSTYITTTTPNVYSLVEQSSSTYDWYIHLNDSSLSLYWISPANNYTFLVHIRGAGTAQNTAVELYECCISDTSANLFQFVSTSNSTSTASGNPTVTSSADPTVGNPTVAPATTIAGESASTWLGLAVTFIVLFVVTVVATAVLWHLGWIKPPRRNIAE